MRTLPGTNCSDTPDSWAYLRTAGEVKGFELESRGTAARATSTGAGWLDADIGGDSFANIR